jgi:hypothetical protein
MYLRFFQSQVSTMQPKPSGGPSMPFLHLPSITPRYYATLFGGLRGIHDFIGFPPPLAEKTVFCIYYFNRLRPSAV